MNAKTSYKTACSTYRLAIRLATARKLARESGRAVDLRDAKLQAQRAAGRFADQHWLPDSQRVLPPPCAYDALVVRDCEGAAYESPIDAARLILRNVRAGLYDMANARRALSYWMECCWIVRA